MKKMKQLIVKENNKREKSIDRPKEILGKTFTSIPQGQLNFLAL